jgi:hypothetical protein
MSTEMCSMIYEFLINAEECQINATSVIYLGMKEDRSVTEEMLKEIVGGAVRRAKDLYKHFKVLLYDKYRVIVYKSKPE